MITLYNERHESVGTTYPRRAKQLVLKGRATWLEEGRTLQLTPNTNGENGLPLMTIEEESTMNDEKTYETNDELLLYIAKQNVAQKKNLRRNIIAYIVAWLLLGLSYDAFVANIMHNIRWRANELSDHWNSFLETSRALQSWRIEDAIDQMIRTAHRTPPPLWYVVIGAMLAWGTWIVFRIWKIHGESIRRFFGRLRPWAKPEKPLKPDPVIAEYQRLKALKEAMEGSAATEEL